MCMCMSLCVCYNYNYHYHYHYHSHYHYHYHYHYHSNSNSKFHSPCWEDSDFDAPPMVLLIGQYSVGKTTFIRYVCERPVPGDRIG